MDKCKKNLKKIVRHTKNGTHDTKKRILISSAHACLKLIPVCPFNCPISSTFDLGGKSVEIYHAQHELALRFIILQ